LRIEWSQSSISWTNGARTAFCTTVVLNRIYCFMRKGLRLGDCHFAQERISRKKSRQERRYWTCYHQCAMMKH
uniref:Uncharacterized protein n=1 Tax=Stegastes partitus TaxID=144197 RepID=A0A3B4ZS90_9TELE